MFLLSDYKSSGTLTIRTNGSKASYQFQAGVEEASDWQLASLRLALALADQIEPTFFSPRTPESQLRELARHFVSWTLPPRIRTTVIDWASADPEVESTLLIDVGGAPDWIAQLPWELLPLGLDLDLFVVRCHPAEKPARPGLKQARILVAGWPWLPNGVRLEGVVREVGQIPARFRGEQLQVEAMLSPSVDDFGAKVREYKPQVLHLAVANGFRVDLVNDTAELVLDPEPSQSAAQTAASGATETLAADRLVEQLRDIDELALCVLNTMPNPVVARSPLYAKLCAELGVAVLGWSGAVQDHVAVDSALFWYQRIVEGAPIADAMRSFAKQYSARQWVLGAMPTIWVPSDAWLEEPLLAAPAAAAAPSTDAGGGLESFRGPAKPTPARSATPAAAPAAVPELPPIRLAFAPQPTLFPSLLINNQPAIRELTIESDLEAPCRLEILCDAGSHTSAFSLIRRLRKGPNTIDVNEVEFPVLYGLIDSDDRRVVTFRVSAWIGDKLEAQETCSVPWRARREWLDSPESWPYVPAFVLPMSQAVAEVVREAERVLAQIGDPRDRFSGYSKSKQDRVERARQQIKALFHALRDRGLKYITPPGSPLYVLDPAVVGTDADSAANQTAEDGAAAESQSVSTAARVSGQLVRLPDDVLRRGHATCHDLALFLASAAEYVGLRPLVVLMPGHTFFGAWLDDEAQADFWKERPAAGREVGERWTIPQAELEGLVKDQGTVVLLESTLVTNGYATFERACDEGKRLLQRTLDTVIDVRASRRQVQSLPVL